jgi:thiol-disulfide isomerase/thioredoxin
MRLVTGVTINALIRSLLIFTLVGLGACFANAQPVNDMFANRITLTGTNITTTGSNVGATAEVGEPSHAGLGCWASVWWSWTAPTNNVATISTAGSSFDTVLAVYTGSSVSALTEVASNDDDPDSPDYTSKVVFDATAGQTYQIAVDGYYGDSGSIVLQVQLAPPQPPPPAPAWVLSDPYGQTVRSTNFTGKVVILDFWATWCNPCKAEMPDLVALQDKYRADGLVIVGADVSWSEDSAQTVIDFLATFSPTLNYQIVMSDTGTETSYGGINAIPTTFIIDRQNLIRMTYVGTQSGSTLEQQIIPLLYDNMRLKPQLNANQLVLRWPTSALSFTLETAIPTKTLAWTNWPTLPTVVNGTNTIQVPTTNKSRLFRLRMPY